MENRVPSHARSVRVAHVVCSKSHAGWECRLHGPGKVRDARTYLTRASGRTLAEAQKAALRKLRKAYGRHMAHPWVARPKRRR